LVASVVFSPVAGRSDGNPFVALCILQLLDLTFQHRDLSLVALCKRRAGSQAYRDVAKSVPLMLVMAVLVRAFPFLPKASRGWAAAGTMMIGATAATVGIGSLYS